MCSTANFKIKKLFTFKNFVSCCISVSFLAQFQLKQQTNNDRTATFFGLNERFTVLTRTLRFHGKAHARHFHIENKNDLHWSLTISPIQILQLQINARHILASLRCIGCWFASLIFKFVVLTMHLEEVLFLVFLVLLCNQRNLSKKVSSAANTKKREWRCPLLVLLVSG